MKKYDYDGDNMTASVGSDADSKTGGGYEKKLINLE
jgi:hypothetical protein